MYDGDVRHKESVVWRRLHELAGDYSSPPENRHCRDLF